jgi:hypothetical protein
MHEVAQLQSFSTPEIMRKAVETLRLVRRPPDRGTGRKREAIAGEVTDLKVEADMQAELRIVDRLGDGFEKRHEGLDRNVVGKAGRGGWNSEGGGDLVDICALRAREVERGAGKDARDPPACLKRRKIGFAQDTRPCRNAARRSPAKLLPPNGSLWLWP